MSIYPKKITEDEAVIIHVRIKNFDDNIKFLQLRTYIEDPNGKIAKKFNKDFLLNLNSERGIYKDFYFEFKPNKKSVLGKYLVKTDLYYKGEILHSLTMKNDYFHIEALDIKKVNIDDNISFFLFNKSKESIEFNIILKKNGKKKIIKRKLNGLEEKNFVYSTKVCDEIYVEYGNLHCERILNNKSNIYIRNYRYNWKCQNNELILCDNKKLIHLNNFLGYIWLSCDGIHTVFEIAKECETKESEIKKVLRKLKRKGLIFKINK